MLHVRYFIVSVCIATTVGILILARAHVFSCTDVSSLAYNEFFVAPDGSPQGDGSLENPWDIQTALGHPSAVQPGDTIWLRGGRYVTGRIDSFLTGTEQDSIIVRQYPGERATIDGGIVGVGAWVTFWGFEITSTSPRIVPYDEKEILRPEGFKLLGRGYKIVNMLIHDTGHPGVGFWRPVGDGGEIHGSLIWGAGIYADGSTILGDAIYAQNEDGTRYITDVIAFWNFTYGIKPGAIGGWADGFVLEGNVGFNNYKWALFYYGSDSHLTQRGKMIRNFTYHEPRDDPNRGNLLGYQGDVYHGDAEIRDNYFVGGVPVLEIRNWQTLTVTGNVFAGGAGTIVRLEDSDSLTQALWDHNTYFGTGDVSEPFQYRDDNDRGFAEWQAITGFDANSTYTPALPTELEVFVRPNKYEPGRGHIIVYNWGLQPAVSVDVSSILNVGDVYQVQDAQNFFGEPVAGGIYDGNLLTLPMTRTEKIALFGEVTHFDRHEQHTAPEFAVFVVLPDSSIQPYFPPRQYIPVIFKP